MKNSRNKNNSSYYKEVLHPSLHLSILVNGHHPSHKYYCTVSYSQKYYYIIAIYNNNTYSAGMKERCRDGCRTSL